MNQTIQNQFYSLDNVNRTIPFINGLGLVLFYFVAFLLPVGLAMNVLLLSLLIILLGCEIKSILEKEYYCKRIIIEENKIAIQCSDEIYEIDPCNIKEIYFPEDEASRVAEKVKIRFMVKGKMKTITIPLIAFDNITIIKQSIEYFIKNNKNSFLE